MYRDDLDHPTKTLVEVIQVSIQIVLADPHPVMLEGLKAVFDEHEDFNVQSCVQDGEAALDAVNHYKPDVLLMELSLPKKNGLSLINDIHQQKISTHPVVFTGASIAEVMLAIDLGVQGLVSKDKPKEFLTRCIRAVKDGNKWLDEDLAMKAVTHLMDRAKNGNNISGLLTSREMAVAKLAMEGWPNKRIASKLCISEGTAKLHLHHIYQKLNCPGRMALVLHMQKNGMS